MRSVLFYVILAMFFLVCGLREALCGLPQPATQDSYLQDFTNFTSGATVQGADYWNVFNGSANNAIAQSSVTPAGTGNAVKLIGALNVPAIDRPFAYGNLTPTWISFKVRPAISNQTPTVPTTGIGAVTCDFTGKVLATDSSVWIDTGATYTIGEWHTVTMKLDFTNHTYDLYYNDAAVPDAGLTLLKTNLKFIDPTINSLSDLKFYGSYSASAQSNVYVDDVGVNYIYRLQIITPPQKLMQGQASGPIVLQLQNANSAPQTTLTDMTLKLKSTSASGTFSLSPDPWVNAGQIIIPYSAQQATFYYKDTATGKPIINAAEYPDHGYLDALQELEIVNKFAGFSVEVISPQVAGEIFNMKITAKDDKGATDETYSGSLKLSVDYISPSKGAFSISPDNVSGFVKGVLKANVQYPDCGLVTVTVTDSEESSQTGTSNQILFLPARFIVSAENPQIVSNPFPVTITAQNARGSITPNYNGIVNLSPVPVTPLIIANGAISPSSITGSTFADGIAKPGISYNLYGMINLQAKDSVDAARSGTSGIIEFLPKSMSVSVTPAGGGRDFFYINEPIQAVVKVLDSLGNPIPNYPGVVELTSGLGLTLPNPYTFNSADAGAHTFSIIPTQPGTYTVVSRAQKSSLVAESPKITVKNATIEVIDTTSPVGTGEVTIQIVDDAGNIITSENGLPITVRVIEESENNSVSLPSDSATFSNGKITLPVTDSEAETVTIIISSPYSIKTKKGTIMFGRAGKTGINQLMWRELKKK